MSIGFISNRIPNNNDYTNKNFDISGLNSGNIVFINAIKNEELEEAYAILQENNIMSDICSNVCPYEEYCMRTLRKRHKRKTC